MGCKKDRASTERAKTLNIPYKAQVTSEMCINNTKTLTWKTHTMDEA
jgi:hypothetical protein